MAPNDSAKKSKKRNRKNKKSLAVADDHASSSGSNGDVEKVKDRDTLLADRKRKLEEVDDITEEIYNHSKTKKLRREHAFDVIHPILSDRMEVHEQLELKQALKALKAEVIMYRDDDSYGGGRISLHIGVIDGDGIYYSSGGDDWDNRRLIYCMAHFQEIGYKKVHSGDYRNYKVDWPAGVDATDKYKKDWTTIVSSLLRYCEDSICQVTLDRVQSMLPFGCIIEGEDPMYDTWTKVKKD